MEGRIDAAHSLTAARWPVTPSWHWCSSEEWNFLTSKHPPSIACSACELWTTHHQCWWPIMRWWGTVIPLLFKPLTKTNPYFCGTGIFYRHRALPRSIWQARTCYSTELWAASIWALGGQWEAARQRQQRQSPTLDPSNQGWLLRARQRNLHYFTSSLSNLLPFCGLAICYHSVAQTFC